VNIGHFATMAGPERVASRGVSAKSRRICAGHDFANYKQMTVVKRRFKHPGKEPEQSTSECHD
jgi:hypothetical protein